MVSVYREIRPSPDLATCIESFWTGEVVNQFTARVLPDGCADILFIACKNELIDMQVVGVMTRPQEVALAAGTFLLGVRFQPGMAGACLGCDLQSLNDRTVSLRSIVGDAATRFARCFSRNGPVEAKTSAIEKGLTSLPALNNIQTAIGLLVGRQGQLSLPDFAALADVGPRQLRRLCLRHSGLAPKHLARILRFRHIAARLRNGESNMAELALSCGYCDQAHMIREFRNLAGISPGQYLRRQPE
jgi:AraC-like DNA-binding protein